MKNRFTSLIMQGLLLAGFAAYAQAPANDEFTGAAPLTVNPGYAIAHITAGTTENATRSLPTSCNANHHDDDVWYTFTATQVSHIVRLSAVTLASGTGTPYRNMEAFESHNGEPGERLACTGVADTEVVLTALTENNTYFVRVYSNDLGAPAGIHRRIHFNICVLTPPAPPGNDEFTSAAELTPHADYTCTHAVSGTTDGATQSTVTSCTPNQTDDDVWYRFTATRASHIIRLSDIALAYGIGTPYRNFEVYENVNSQPGERLACTGVTDTEVLLTALTAGEGYFVRVYANNLGTSDGSQRRIHFNICILTPPAPPANDAYATAAELTPNPDYDCTAAVSGTTEGATQSARSACASNQHDDDVWYKFTATRVSHIVRLSGITPAYGPGTPHRNFEVFTSLDDQPDELLACTGVSDTEALLTGLTTGALYFVRVYANDLGSPGGIRRRINFNICILSPVAPPANDDYTHAQPLTVNPGTDCAIITSGTTDGATQTDHNACHTDYNDDVWFSFTATQNSHTLRLTDITAAYGRDTWRYAEIFTNEENTPGSRIFCASGINFTETTLAGLTVGNSYYIRVYTYSTLIRINFTICLLTPPVPGNDDCAGAVTISDGLPVSAANTGAGQSLDAGDCSSGTAYDVWFKATPVTSGELVVTAGTSAFDLVLEAFTGTCDALAPVMCLNEAGGNETLTIAHAQENVTYYFRVYNHTPANTRVAAETGSFTIRATGAALPVTLASFSVAPDENGAAGLSWTTTEEVNSSHFEVEHSRDGQVWEQLCTIVASGNNDRTARYHYLHLAPSAGLNYYRLRSVDRDGSSTYSGIVSLDSGIHLSIAYPNPASDWLRLADWDGIAMLKLFDATGHEVPVVKDPANNTLSVGHLPAGNYLLHIHRHNGARHNGARQTLRIVVAR